MDLKAFRMIDESLQYILANVGDLVVVIFTIIAYIYAILHIAKVFQKSNGEGKMDDLIKGASAIAVAGVLTWLSDTFLPTKGSNAITRGTIGIIVDVKNSIKSVLMYAGGAVCGIAALVFVILTMITVAKIVQISKNGDTWHQELQQAGLYMIGGTVMGLLSAQLFL
ncbi:MAG: hypothetical protein ACRCUP_01280 [Mycoplasmatales bacterium]